jgi:hypothetical protein
MMVGFEHSARQRERMRGRGTALQGADRQAGLIGCLRTRFGEQCHPMTGLGQRSGQVSYTSFEPACEGLADEEAVWSDEGNAQRHSHARLSAVSPAGSASEVTSGRPLEQGAVRRES